MLPDSAISIGGASTMALAATKTTLLRPILGGILGLAAAMGIGRFAYTPILPAMQQAARLDTAQAGFLASANYAGYLVGALLIVVAVPVGARRNVLAVSLVTVVATTALMASTTHPVVWGAVRFLSGLASAGVFVLASGLVLDLLRRAGQAARSGWLYTGPGLGIAVSGLVVRVAGRALGWRGDWLVLALLATAAAYSSWRWLPCGDGAGKPVAAPQPMRIPGSPAALPLLFAAYTLEGVGYIVTGTFLVAIVERMPGLEGWGASVWIVVGLAALPASVLWATSARHLGYPRALALAYFVQACGILLPMLGSAVAAVAAALLFGGTFLGISALTLALAGHLAPHGSARLIGMLTVAYGLGQVIGPVLAGLLVTRTGSFGPALLAASAIVLLGAGLMLALARLDRK